MPEMTSVNRFGFIPVRSGLMSQADCNAILSAYLPGLESVGGERWSDPVPDRPEPLAFFVVSGGTEASVLELYRKHTAHDLNRLVLLIAHPNSNSLPAALEVLARLQQEGVRGRIAYLSGPDDARGLEQLRQAVADFGAFAAMRQARIGLVGPSSDWLVASMPSHVIVRELWGPTVVPIPLETLVHEMNRVPEDALMPLAGSLLESASEVREPSLEAALDGVRVYLGLRNLIERYGLGALTVRCFDLVVGLKTTGCFALAQLNDEGVVAGCEGDLPTAIGMLWARTVLGEVSWMANPARLDAESNTLWMAHCTVPRSMVRQYRLRSHFESGLGLGIQGEFEPGPVTLLRIGGRNMDRVWLAEASILRCGDEPQLCRTQVEVQLERGGRVSDLLEHPLGNHLVLVRGHHLDRLRRYRAAMLGEGLD